MSYLLPPITNPRRQFEFEIKLLADSLSFGGDASRFLGSGLEYAQSRPYEPGDPVKLIDWRVTARTGKPFVKEYEAARQVPIYLAVDTSASMCVGSVEQSKYYWAVRLAAGIALAGLERLSPVGVVAGGERDLRVTPTLSSQSLLQWAEQLRQYDFRERTLLSSRLRTLAASLKSRSIVFVLSDLHDEGAINVIELLATNHEVVVLWLQDPAEVTLPRGGIFRAREAETGSKAVLHGWTKLSTNDRIRESLVQSGIEFLHLPIDSPVLPRVRYFLKHRKSLGHD
ncbi:hypothetical protein ETAA8_48440 [Anatilimnocola aggregata]|uniref:DUF58 domain-containing protein n=1 Tax=Anatilimnocola aggregata TaxID=2528021 RepID=A0A517YHP0_9BACT|nr:DUF58 domain-containing protein [Anatilimnocola aggregata]QDU29729.1 hypothetical protein ETAA8_48440 [Anatilimnocola aggregata]